MAYSIEFGENLIVEQKYNPFDLTDILDDEIATQRDVEKKRSLMLGYNPTRICIGGNWFDTIPLHILARTKSTDDYYRFVYIQINFRTGEYYIGKVNRRKWNEIKRYQGSGLLFTSKYEKHKGDFVRYYIASCNTQQETEEIEGRIVNENLLGDEKCLNLVRGGTGTNNHYDREKRSKRQKDIMKEHPEFFQSMIQTSKEIFCSGPSIELDKRNKKIKDTMSDEKYREMTRERILNWKENCPEEYMAARANNKRAQQSAETKEKKRKGREKWIKENPELYEANKSKALAAAHLPEAEEKRKESIRSFYRDNPERASEIVKKRVEASVKACSKSVNMLDLDTGQVIMTFDSQHDAARWLVERGLAKNINCASSISAVCMKKPCSTGYGFRKKAYGYGWEYRDDKSDQKKCSV